MFRDYLQGFPAFIAHFAVALCFAAMFLAIYTRVTRHDEFKLMREGNLAAAVALCGSFIGFALPLSSAVEHSVSITDNVIWATISLVIQIGVYFAVKMSMPDLNERIQRSEVSAGLWLGSASIVAGQLASAAMTT